MSAADEDDQAAERSFLQGRPAAGAGHYLRDIVYGANDGAITTLAIIAGVEGALMPASVALVLGAANIVADGISMATASYLSLKSDLEQRGVAVRLERPFRHAGVTFAAFGVAGTIPLVAYGLASWLQAPAVLVAGAISLATLALLGVWRAPFVRRGRARSALETALIGGLAALAAYLVGFAARAYTGAA